MKTLLTALRNTNYLKNYGRLQLGLFIKGLGLTIDEAQTFWKKEFTKKMDKDKFEKGYGNYIRYVFGKQSMNYDYKPWSCNKILNLT